jgi:hypothetical protein
MKPSFVNLSWKSEALARGADRGSSPHAFSCETLGKSSAWLAVLTAAGEQQKFQNGRSSILKANLSTLEHL